MSVATDFTTGKPTRLAPVVFTLTIFLSASLLFFVQPLFAKIALPVIGGAPAVWTTAMLFFQSVLIGGYLYAHLSTKFLAIPLQVGLHIVLWAIALAFLPPELPQGWTLDGGGGVAIQTLGLFALGIGVPFALLSANAPLIQSWYRHSGGPSADDPYFLYGASNLGSLTALLAFPLAAEPLLGASAISMSFAGGFVLLGAGLLGSGVLAIKGKGLLTKATDLKELASLDAKTIALWASLAFVPSSLMLAVTSKISTDIGALPLVWVLPLAMFLLTFVLTFTNNTIFQLRWLKRASLLSVTAATALFLGVLGPHFSLAHMAILLAAFFFITLWAHRTLYELRPAAEHLTLFYVIMSVGGALGGLFNSIVAPVLFSGLYEGVLTLAVALLLMFRRSLDFTPSPLLKAAAVGLLAGAALIFILQSLGPDATAPRIFALAVPATLCLWLFKPNLTAGGVALVALLLPPMLMGPDDQLFRDRSFFGLHRVLDQDGARYYSNGTTVHGAQRLDQLTADQPTPSSYYHPAGPMGQIMASDLGTRATSIGIVGLGVGSLACYGRPGQDWQFYEIDKMVDQVARNPALFTFMSKCAKNAPTHIGDARVVLEAQFNARFDVLVIDAFSSNSVPMHLTTKEAVEIYANRLSDDGIVIFHISNRYYDLAPPLTRIASSLGLKTWLQVQGAGASDDPGFRPSVVLAMTRADAATTYLHDDPRWTRQSADRQPPWSDDKANPLSALKPEFLPWN
ncbi:MAG: transporter [Boseongicola sp.]|nr:MAG: transporter [Boseongicola sp.]